MASTPDPLAVSTEVPCWLFQVIGNLSKQNKALLPQPPSDTGDPLFMADC